MDGNGDTEAENVIRLPRDWVGPPEELVPLGSRAREARAAGAPADDGDPRDVIPDAGDFWGETASAVHHVMRAPTETWAAGRARPRRARLRVRRRTAVIAVIAGVTAGAAILGVSEGHGPRPTASLTAAAQAQADMRKSAAMSHAATMREGHRGLSRVARARTRPAPVRAFSERPSARPVTGRRRQARRDRSLARHATARQPQAVIATAVTTPVPTTQAPTPTPTPAASTPSAAAPTTATTARDRAGTSATSTGRLPSSGPLGPGDASGCDPKCS